MATKDKPNNKNIRALFSVICLCIVALGLIVYFSTQSRNTSDVNEATTVADTTKAETSAASTKEQTTEKSASSSTSKKAAKKSASTVATTEVSTMTSGDTNVPYKSFYKYPCSETVLTGYSEELVKNDTMNDYRAHTAVDFKAAAGTEVKAINDGLVLSVTKDALLGTVIEIDHGAKLVGRYCGMDTVNVAEGDYVTIGEAIGTVGTVSFEADSESHLHFETLLDDKYVNPLDVMGKTD